jgi:hypothetical protein
VFPVCSGGELLQRFRGALRHHDGQKIERLDPDQMAYVESCGAILTTT